MFPASGVLAYHPFLSWHLYLKNAGPAGDRRSSHLEFVVTLSSAFCSRSRRGLLGPGRADLVGREGGRVSGDARGSLRKVLRPPESRASHSCWVRAWGPCVLLPIPTVWGVPPTGPCHSGVPRVTGAGPQSAQILWDRTPAFLEVRKTCSFQQALMLILTWTSSDKKWGRCSDLNRSGATLNHSTDKAPRSVFRTWDPVFFRPCLAWD